MKRQIFLTIWLVLHLMCSGNCANCIYEERQTYYSDSPTSIRVTCYNITSAISLDFDNENSVLAERLVIDEDSTVERLPSNSSLSAFTFLKSLTLRFLDIEEILPGAFDGLEKLEDLDLSMNKLGEISEGAFNNLKKLKGLDLSENQISKISRGIFDNLTLLERLDLSNNLVSDINEDGFSNLVSLRTLNLKGNNLTVLRENVFKNLTSLETVRVSDNPLKEIQNVGFRNRLVVLEASDTSLRNFSFNLSQLSIDYFDLSRNNLEEFDFSYSRANTLDLSNNHITTIKNLDSSKCAIIDLSNNDIAEIRTVSPTVVSLNLHHNKIKNFFHYPSSGDNVLSDLDLSFNEVTSVSCYGFTNLVNLNFEKNAITVVPKRSFILCQNLITLDLSSNKIERLEPNAFEGLSLLRVLDISDNRLKNLDSASFPGLTSLYNLRVDNNRISSMDMENLMRNVPQIMIINLDKNAFFCDDLVTIIKVLRSYHVQEIDIDYVDFETCNERPTV